MNFDQVLEHVSDGVVRLDRDWRVQHVNRRAELLFGKRRTEMVGQTWWELFPSLAGTPAEDEFRGAAAGEVARRFRVFYPARYAWHEVWAIPEEDGVTLVIRDVTDIARSRQSEAVRDAVREVIDQAPVAISLLRGPEHRVEVMNQLARQLLGGQDLEGRSARAALPELEGQGFFELLDQVYRTGKPYQAREVPVHYDRHGDGRMYDGCFDIVYQPIFDPDGTVSGVLSMSVEVSHIVEERKRTERRGAEIEAVLAQLLEGVIITDPGGRITFVNEVAERLHGVARLDVGPEEYTESYHLLTEDGAPYPPEELPLARAVRRGEVVTGARWRIRRPDGTEVAVTGEARPVFGQDGKMIAAVLTLRPAASASASPAAPVG